MISASVKPDSITFASILPSISESANLDLAKEIHCYVIRQGVPLDMFLKSALIDVYFKCKNVEMAQNLFNRNTEMDIVIFTTMISGYVLNRMKFSALDVFRWLLLEL